MKSKILDVVGISAAILCLIHCVAFPLLMIVPLGISHNPFIDLAFLVTGAIVVYRISKKTQIKWLKALFAVSLLLISVSVFADMIFEVHLPLMYFGAAGLIAGHLINFNHHKH
ncbi:MerC domain-containing protein [uncultured Chryseobacterium sp.]|uniref:MerC domain-containing protein n=1 Tax=uncultured Chryseobacterium sp. TaxID=259322 RepID=UPI0025D31C0E|nr:MerC domain-containing protein [uncultured Chryseobacterium sp.]